MFKIFETVEDGREVTSSPARRSASSASNASEYDEALTGSRADPVPPHRLDGGVMRSLPNQVGRIVTLYEDGLLFRYEPAAEGDQADPAEQFLKPETRHQGQVPPALRGEGLLLRDGRPRSWT